MRSSKLILCMSVFVTLSGTAVAQRVPMFVKTVSSPLLSSYVEHRVYPIMHSSLEGYVPTPTAIKANTQPTAHLAATPQTEAVSLANGKGIIRGKHSIVPSASTILGSDAFRTTQARQIDLLRKQAENAMTTEYLPTEEQQYWASEREVLFHMWRTMEPATIDKLPSYLAHPVPPETLEDAVQSYTTFVDKANRANHEIMTKIIYASMPGEGKRFNLQEKIYLNKLITDMRMKVVILRNAFVKDPYLMAQQTYWTRVFVTFNPLLEGLLIKLDLPRPDKRTYDYHEFVLSNPDHSTPYLPGSQSLIKGEAEDDDYDDYEDGYDNYGNAMPAHLRAAQLAAEREHFNKMMAFTQEEEELLSHIPENLHIAFINDDANPRLNMESWAKKGHLGKGATVDTFKEGASFLSKVKNGTHYDIVITDLLVPKGGIVMMRELRELDPFITVIASSKFYPGDGDAIKTEDGKEVLTAEDYFHAGIDGYMWYNNNLDAGSYGFIQYLRSMKNYYYYKNLHGWAR